jgi:hypothetical protein
VFVTVNIQLTLLERGNMATYVTQNSLRGGVGVHWYTMLSRSVQRLGRGLLGVGGGTLE